MIKFELTQEELNACVGLMDAGVKGAGLQAVRQEVVTLLEKFTQAVNAQNKEAANGND